jgi:serine O-acetyltransferase
LRRIGSRCSGAPPADSAWAGTRLDQDYFAQRFERYRPRPSGVALLANPSLRAAFLFRICANGGRSGLVARNLLIALHGCDVSAGASFAGALYLPHPIAIVVGNGVTVGRRASIFQDVTLGSDRHGGYPTIGDDVVVYPGATIVGAVKIGDAAVIGAGALVTHDVEAEAVVRGRHAT